MQNLKYALRLLNKNRLFSIAIIVTMALAIGANTAAFSVVNALLFRPLSVQDPGQLVQLQTIEQQDDGTRAWGPWSYPDFADYRNGASSAFSGVTLYKSAGFLVGAGTSVSRAFGGVATRDFFRVIGIRPILGRTFAPNEDTPTAPLYQVVISKSFWQSHFGGGTSPVGKTLAIDHHQFKVVGVVDAPTALGALIGTSPDVWITLGTFSAMGEGCRPLNSRPGPACYRSFARLKPGVGMTAAREAIDIVTERLARKYPKTHEKQSVVVSSAGTLYGLMGYDRHQTLVIALSLMGVALTILFIACANIVNLFLARGARRVREIAIRMTLGADGPAIARQLLTEALLLSLIGAGAGLAAGWVGINYINGLPAFDLLDITLDWRVLLFTGLIALAAGLLFSLAPMWPVMKMDLFSRLTMNSDTPGTRQSRVRDGLVVLQVALCLALLVCAGLFVRTLDNAYHTDLGFDPAHVLVADVDFPGSEPPSRADLDRVRKRIEALPGIQAVGFITSAPFAGGRMMVTALHIPGFDAKQQADFATAVEGYFKALGAPLLQGSRFSAFAPSNEKIVMVNQAFVKRYWPDGWTRGKPLRIGDDVFTVAGVVGDIRHNSVSDPQVPRLYYRFPHWAYASLDMVVRSVDQAADHQAAVAKAVHELYPRVPPPRTYTMAEKVAGKLAPVTQTSVFLLAFGAIALVLAVVGIYALLAYLVTQRTAEIGLRQAVGADYWDIIVLFARKSAMLVLIGVVIGLGAAVAVMRTLQHFLYGVTPSDPTTLAGAVVVFTIVAGVATYIPARRAAKLDPAIAMME